MSKLVLTTLGIILLIQSTLCIALCQTTKVEKVESCFIPANNVNGDFMDVNFSTDCRDSPRSAPNCTQVTYVAENSMGKGWVEINWLFPRENWGSMPGKINLFNDASKLTFWAKGEVGGEKAEFKVGGISGEYYDSLRPAKSTGLITLTPEWMQYSIDLRSRDLSHVIGGFCWVAEAVRNPAGSTIYVDDIQYEWD